MVFGEDFLSFIYQKSLLFQNIKYIKYEDLVFKKLGISQNDYRESFFPLSCVVSIFFIFVWSLYL